MEFQAIADAAGDDRADDGDDALPSLRGIRIGNLRARIAVLESLIQGSLIWTGFRFAG